MARKLITAPASEPVTLTEAKAFLRVDSSADDTLIGDLIAAARDLVETSLNRRLVSQSWQLTLDAFPGAGIAIRVPYPPFVSVTTLKYRAADGTLTTWGASNYVADIQSTPGRVYPATGISWPEVWDLPNAVELVFACGAAVADVPGSIKTGIKMIVADVYERRELAGLGRAEAILSRYRIPDFGS